MENIILCIKFWQIYGAVGKTGVLAAKPVVQVSQQEQGHVYLEDRQAVKGTISRLETVIYLSVKLLKDWLKVSLVRLLF